MVAVVLALRQLLLVQRRAAAEAAGAVAVQPHAALSIVGYRHAAVSQARAVQPSA
jgi:hypothetical protein